MELDTHAAVSWLHQDDIRDRFLMALGTPAELKRRTYSILVPFLPVRSQIEDQEWLRNVEAENNLGSNTITATRWAKPIERRSAEQQVTHAIFVLTNPDTANTLLRDGLYIQKTKLHPRKEHKDPLHCAKCQGWGHLAQNCLIDHDTCTRYGNNH